MNPYTRGNQFREAEVVAPSDNADLPRIGAQLYVGGAGNVRVILSGDTTPVTFSGAQAGSYHPIYVNRVLNTGTTATNILALYPEND